MNYEAILARFAGTTILIVGDVMLDEYVWGDVSRISQEAPVPVVEAQRRSYAPGGASNVATNVVSLGGRAWLGGVVGQDEQANQLRQMLAQSDVTTEGLLPDTLRPTTTKTRIIAHSQQVVRVDSERRDPLPEALEAALLAWAAGQMASAGACVLSDYSKGVITPTFAQSFILLAKQHGKPVIVDPKGTDYSKYRGAAVIKPNIHELGHATRQDVSGEAGLRSAAAQIMSELDGSALLVTRGSEGMALFRSGDAAPTAIPPVVRTVYDSTGAGDTVVSTLALALGAGAALEPSARLANHAASIVVGKLGTARVTLEELIHDASQ